MKLPAAFEKGDLFWYAIIAGTAAAALLATFAGLLFGISTGIPHLLYIPVVLAAYKYPRRGAVIAGCIGGIYLLIVILLAGSSPVILAEALVRTLVIVVIGWLIATLLIRLREQEDLYQGLFDHSEGGSILIADIGKNRTIEEINWKAATILHRKAADLKGTSVTTIWSGEDNQEFFGRLSREGAVYATETKFTLPDENTFIVLVSAASLPGERAILTFFDITGRVHAEHALKMANDKLSLLSQFSSDHLHHLVDDIIETVDEADTRCRDTGIHTYFEQIRALAWSVARQLFLTESYKDLGTVPPVWISVQRLFETTRLPSDDGTVSIRCWTGRLEVYADPLFSDVLSHLLENSLRHSGGRVKNIVVTYHETPDGLDLCIRDDGAGIPPGKKQQIFEYDAGGHAGIGLFICRQIVEVTDMTIQETGSEGQGARFVIHVPPGGYRIEGTGDDAPPLPLSSEPVLHPVKHSTGAIVKELGSPEFSIAETLWTDYHNTKGDKTTDRIFAAFHDGQAVSVARCKRHPDGFEVDGVFTPVSQRGHGYANAVVWALVDACGQETLYMHSVWDLAGFYGNYGFVPIDEKELPPTIRERFAWAQGEMQGANVRPMRRNPNPA
ncbi:ATP-binding protein [uncultured Methanoregula sp.]|uniref:ATP-binding protein n=1 Tax=uncultured Methanoregula sp. TaxID=1005933 RepID=UPI002AAC3083|nr:ATP-binding protein [uncultured Methanoregula sp.]